MKNDKEIYHPEFTTRDIAMLEWFFTRGLSWFGGSTFGAQLERAHTYANGSKECRKCRGTGWVKRWVGKCRHCEDGYTKATSGRFPLICSHCNGRRVIEYESRVVVKGVRVYQVDDVCAPCRGLGTVMRRKHMRVIRRLITADLDGDESFDVHEFGELHELRWYGEVMRRLPHVSERSARTLYAYWCVGGAYVRREKIGRYLPVIALTVAGKRLVERFRDKPPKAYAIVQDFDSQYDFMKDWSDLTQPEILIKLLESEDTVVAPGFWRRAHEQAVTIVGKAAREWAQAGRMRR